MCALLALIKCLKLNFTLSELNVFKSFAKFVKYWVPAANSCNQHHLRKKMIYNVIDVLRTVPVSLVCYAPESNQQWPSPTLLFTNIQF